MTKMTALSTSAALALAFACGLLYVELRSQSKEAIHERLRGQGLSDRLRAAESDALRLKAQIERLRRREEEPLAMSREPGAAPPADDAPCAAPGEPAHEPAAKAPAAPSPRLLDEAEGRAREFVARGDLEGLWLMALELLALGEPGYEKTIALASLINEKDAKTWALWQDEAQAKSRLLHALGEHSEEVLKFGLYLEGREAAELPKLLRAIQGQFAAELGATLLGSYAGDDPQILNGYLDLYRKRIAADPGRDDGAATDAVRGLGQIPTEEAAGVLIDLLARTKGRTQEAVIRSLALQRSASALPALRSFQASLNEPPGSRLKDLVEAAVRLVE